MSSRSTIAPARTGLAFTQTVLIAGALALTLSGLGAWIFAPSPVALWAVALFIVVAALCAIGLKLASKAGHRAGARKAAHRAADGDEPDARCGTAAVTQGAGVAVQGKRWSLDVFAAIDAQRFAAVCEAWFSWAGFDTRFESHRTQEGVDIWLHAARLPGPVAIVRCKHPQDKPVELRDMQEFLGVVARNKSAHGTYTTTSTYTPEALQFAREHGIDAVDGKALLRRILTRTRQSQQALLAVAYNGR